MFFSKLLSGYAAINFGSPSIVGVERKTNRNKGSWERKRTAPLNIGCAENTNAKIAEIALANCCFPLGGEITHMCMQELSDALEAFVLLCPQLHLHHPRWEHQAGQRKKRREN